MNKAELVDAIAEVCSMHKNVTAEVLNAMLEVIVKAVSEGEEVRLVGFGTFKKAAVAARDVRNPQTGVIIKLDARNKPKFLPGSSFKEAVNK